MGEKENLTNQNQASSDTSDNLVPHNDDSNIYTVPSEKKDRKRKQITIFLVLLLILATALGLAAYSQRDDKNSQPVADDRVLNAAKPQYPSGDYVAGYLEYDPDVFEEITPQLKIQNTIKQEFSEQDKNKVVVFPGNILGFEESGLYLYDLSNNKAMKLTDGGGSPRIMSDHFIIYGSSRQEGNSTIIGFELLDLQNGEKTTITNGDMFEFADSSCCSVSPDGFKLAIPRKDKIDVWDIRDSSIKTFPVTLSPLSKNFPTDKEFYKGAPYFTEISYPTPTWLDNEIILFADGTPTSVRVDMDGTINKDPENNTIYALNINSGVPEKLENSEGRTYEIYTSNDGKMIFLEQADSIIKIDLPGNIMSDITPSAGGDVWNMFSLAGNRLYTFPVIHGSDDYLSYDLSQEASMPERFNPLPSEINEAEVTQIIPEAWLDEDLMLIKITETNSAVNKEYEAIYSVTTNKVLQYIELK